MGSHTKGPALDPPPTWGTFSLWWTFFFSVCVHTTPLFACWFRVSQVSDKSTRGRDARRATTDSRASATRRTHRRAEGDLAATDQEDNKRGPSVVERMIALPKWVQLTIAW
jgi:hypothetical protein